MSLGKKTPSAECSLDNRPRSYTPADIRGAPQSIEELGTECLLGRRCLGVRFFFLFGLCNSNPIKMCCWWSDTLGNKEWVALDSSRWHYLSMRNSSPRTKKRFFFFFFLSFSFARSKFLINSANQQVLSN